MPDLSVIKNLFDFQEFGPTYNKLDPSVGRWWYTNWFASKQKRQTILKTVRVLTVASSQIPGKLNLAGQPNVVQPPGYSDTDHTSVRQADKTELTTEIVVGLMKNASKWERMTAGQLLDDKIRDMKRKQYLLMEAMLAHMFVYNRINFDSNLRLLLPTVHATTGAITNHANTVVSIDFGVPDANRGNVNSLITAQWSTAGTDIQKQLNAIDKAQMDRGCPPIAEIHCNINDQHHIWNNTLVKTWVAANPQALQQLLTGGFITGLFGKKWVFHAESYVDPVGGSTVIDQIPQTLALMVPADGDWLRAYEGMEPMDKMPEKTRFSSTGEAMADLAYVPGEFGYVAKESGQPPTYWMNGINNWGVAMAEPNAVLVGKVFTG